jgi:branched-chain amino acid transport system substrate-binding protein
MFTNTALHFSIVNDGSPRGFSSMQLSRKLAPWIGAAGLVAGIVAVPMTGAGAASSKSPIVIAFLGIETGPDASPTANDPVTLAADQINAAGGVDGHQIELKFYDANVTPGQAVTATQQAMGTNPTAIIGPFVDAQVQATASLLKQSGIPTLGMTSGPLTDFTNTHLNNFWDINPIDYNTARAAATYVAKTYKPASIGEIYSTDAASTASAGFIEGFLKKDGVKKLTERSEADTVTDATNAVLAVKSSKVVFVNSFPAIDGLFLSQLAQNGYTGPIVAAQADNSIQAFKLAPAADLANTDYTPYCDPDVQTTPQAKSFVSAYDAKFHVDQSAADDPASYDGVYMIAKAIKEAGGNTSHASIVSKINKMSYRGACGPYKADSEHTLMNQVEVVKLGATGPAGKKLLATYTFPEIPANAK